MDKKLIVLYVLVLAFFVPTLQAQIKWPEGKKAAVILTYDDNLKSHHEVVMPQLEAKGFRGTFFLYGYPMKAEDIPQWRDVSKRGHELGNHSMFHQCATEVTDAPLDIYADSFPLHPLSIKSHIEREADELGRQCHY